MASRRASAVHKSIRPIIKALPLSSREVYVSEPGLDAEEELAFGDGEAAAPTALRFDVATADAGERLDKLLARWMPEVSRSRLRQWIDCGAVRVNGAEVRPRHGVIAGDLVELVPQPAADAAAYLPEPMPLAIVHEDDTILVVDKPAGLVVHPAAGHWSGTLLNGLLAHAPALAGVPRAGIVHRLDADTSGLMVVAKTLAAQTDLVRQLQARSVEREYWAVVLGEPRRKGIIDAPIGRDPRNPLRFRVSQAPNARPARTHYTRLASTAVQGVTLSWLACRLETGRTHQIRVHCEHLGHPLVGDPVYRRGLPSPTADSVWRGFPRQALHACRLGLIHPATGVGVTWFRAPPPDLAGLMVALGFGPTDRPREDGAA
jgi:23S rRNA pseudouridine1911/1915/1917 synthase